MLIRPKARRALRWALRVAAHLFLLDPRVRRLALRALAEAGESAEW